MAVNVLVLLGETLLLALFRNKFSTVFGHRRFLFLEIISPLSQRTEDAGMFKASACASWGTQFFVFPSILAGLPVLGSIM